MDFWTLGVFTFGLFAIYLGIMVRLGRLRWLFLGGGFPVLAPLGAFLIATPVGLVFVTIGLMMIFPGANWGYLMLFFVSITIVLSFWTPSWLLPDWLHWLMENYEHVLGEMFEEARQMGIKEWEEATRTQEGLERWADSVARKHGWRRLQR